MAVNVAELKATLIMDMTAFTGNANTAISTLNNIKAAADNAKTALQAMGAQAASLRSVATALTRVADKANLANTYLQAFASNAGLFNSLNASLASITQTATTLAQSLQGVVQQINQMATQAAGLNTLNTQLSNSVTHLTNLNRLGHALVGIGTQLTFVLTLPLVGLGKEALDTTVRFDSLGRALTAITGSAKEAEIQMARLNEIAKAPGIGIEEAVQGSINLQSAGINAQLAERSVKAFGNALVYSGRGKGELAEVEQILAKIEGREILSERQFTQLTLKVPKMRALLKEAFGTGDVEKIQKSGLRPEEIIERLVYAAEQIPKVTGGIQNDIDNFKDSVVRSLKVLGDAIEPLAHEFLTKLAPAIENFANWFKSLPDWGKTSIIIIGGIVAALGPLVVVLGQVALAISRIQLLNAAGGLSGIASSIPGWGAAGGMVSAAALPVGVIAAGAMGANYLNEVVDKREGKAPVDNMDVFGRVLRKTPLGILYGMISGESKKWIAEEDGLGPDTKALADYKAQRAAGHSIRADVEKAAGGGNKPAGWGTLPEGEAQRLKREKDAREINRAKLDSELADSRSKIDTSEPGHALNAYNELAPILQQQAQDLRKEAAEMKISQNSTADEWKQYYRINSQASAKEIEIQHLKAAGVKEQQNAAKELRQTTQRISEMHFRAAEADAQADALDTAPEGMKARTLSKTLTPILKGRQRELIALWQAAGNDTANANELAVRRAQIEEEYWQINRKGAQINRNAADEVLKNQKKAEQESIAAAKAYRSFQSERIKVLAEDTDNEAQKADVLAREIPQLRQDQAELLNEVKNISPNTKQYWDDARAFWQIEDQIVTLTRNQAKGRAAEIKKANQAAQTAAHEHREMLDLETKLMESRLKNNPFINDQQRKNLMVPMLIKQYRALMMPVQGETELESLRRQIDAENMKHDILEQFGMGKANGQRVLGGGRLNMTGLNPRALRQAMAQLDAPYTDSERRGVLDPHVRAQQMAREAAANRPVVYQVVWQPGMSKDQMKQEVWKTIDEMATQADPTPNRS